MNQPKGYGMLNSCVHTSSRAIVLAVIVLGWGCAAKSPPKEVKPVGKRAPVQRTALLTIDSGPIIGERLDPETGLCVYRGIPYAAPPVGDLRWRPPQPPKPWTDPRECLTFGSICPQPSVKRKIPIEGKPDEDCLYLNVWTRAKPGAKRPVMVWIHGGGHVMGAGSQSMYDGSKFAEEGVVLVSINYRLGVLGYLAHPELSAESPNKVSGNYGLLDQIAALKWVRANAASFGGDPSNVTIFGESAGGVSCCALMLSPLAKGLFHRAILQSGTAVLIQNTLSNGEKNAETSGVAFADTVKAKNLSELRQKTVKELLGGSQLGLRALSKGIRLGPIIDGHVIPDAPVTLLQNGKFHIVPTIVGTNADEATLFMQKKKVKRAVGYRFLVKKVFGNDADAILKAFPVGRRDDPTAQLQKLFTVSFFTAPARIIASKTAKNGAPTYLYHFEKASPVMGSSTKLGATHGIEIFYLFGTAKRVLENRDDAALSKTIRQAWIQFAKNGDPNNPDLPKWPRYDSEKAVHMIFGDTVKTGTDLLKKECDLLTKIIIRKKGLTAPK